MKYTVIPASQCHLDAFHGRLRIADELEVRAASGISGYEALCKSLNISTIAWTFFLDGVPAGMGGVASASMLSRVGVPWMMGTDVIRTARVEFVRTSKRYLCMIQSQYDVLHNWVDARNEESKRWLIRLGFNLSPAEPYGVAGAPFHYFAWRADRV